MLKNLNPLLSGALLATIDAMETGDWLTLSTTPQPEYLKHTRVVEMAESTVEEIAAAVFSVLPLDGDREGVPPIVFLDDSPGAELPDEAYAVRGIASDAELRRIDMMRVTADYFQKIAKKSVFTIQSGETQAPYSFLFRKGRC